MGIEVPARAFSYADRRHYREKERGCLDVLAQMLLESRFSNGPQRLGLEVEFNLVDEAGLPSMRNSEVLAAIGDEAWKPELGRFNLEVNLAPRPVAGDALTEIEQQLTSAFARGDLGARLAGTRLAMVGILPSVRACDVTEAAMSSGARYRLLNEQMCAARGEEMRICLDGPEGLLAYVGSIMPEAACTSVQFHIQVSPEAFARYWNAAQVIAGVQVALGANAPYLFGREVWRETRIPLFEQATDTRPQELQTQGVKPRVWFGERWITSVFDLFEENLRYFTALLPWCGQEDAATVLAEGRTPELSELTLHNGTIYRWNRPIYAVEHGEPHLRVENRVLPAGPTVIDVMANAALYYGLVHMVAEAERPVWTQMSFAAARDNLSAAARHGIDACLYWPGLGEVPVTELVLRRLLPLAHEGLRRWNISTEDTQRLLGVIEQRCLTGRNGATWQVESVHALEERCGVPRETALREVTQRYLKLMSSGEPVHTWPLA